MWIFLGKMNSLSRRRKFWIVKQKNGEIGSEKREKKSLACGDQREVQQVEVVVFYGVSAVRIIVGLGWAAVTSRSCSSRNTNNLELSPTEPRFFGFFCHFVCMRSIRCTKIKRVTNQ